MFKLKSESDCVLVAAQDKVAGHHRAVPPHVQRQVEVKEVVDGGDVGGGGAYFYGDGCPCRGG